MIRGDRDEILTINLNDDSYIPFPIRRFMTPEISEMATVVLLSCQIDKSVVVGS